MRKRVATILLSIHFTSVLFAAEIAERISVTITGEIENPGIYKINEESAMVDAVFAAGGFTRKAKTWEVIIVSRHGRIRTENFRKIKREVEERYGILCASKAIIEYRKLSQKLSNGDTIIVAEPSE